MAADTVLEIIAQGAWNGGRLVDNSIYENKGMTFKGGIPVNNKTIEERIGVRTRVVAPEDERIGVLAFQDLLQTSDIDPSRIKLVIGATNIGEDKLDSGPLIRHPFQLVKEDCPDAQATGPDRADRRASRSGHHAGRWALRARVLRIYRANYIDPD